LVVLPSLDREGLFQEKAMQQIVIAQRGWVFIGDVTRTADEVIIQQAAVVRRWGTTKGLGQLALTGPTNETQLDPCPTVRIHPLAIIATMDCAPWPL
jgi:hypothetical protein